MEFPTGNPLLNALLLTSGSLLLTPWLYPVIKCPPPHHFFFFLVCYFHYSPISPLLLLIRKQQYQNGYTLENFRKKRERREAGHFNIKFHGGPDSGSTGGALKKRKWVFFFRKKERKGVTWKSYWQRSLSTLRKLGLQPLTPPPPLRLQSWLILSLRFVRREQLQGSRATQTGSCGQLLHWLGESVPGVWGRPLPLPSAKVNSGSPTLKPETHLAKKHFDKSSWGPWRW